MSDETPDGAATPRDTHWSRAAVLRLAIATLVLIAALFLFVFPTSAVLHQRSQLSDAEQRLSVLERRTIAFASFDDPPALPPSTSIAYLVGTPSQAWLAVLVHTTIVDIS